MSDAISFGQCDSQLIIQATGSQPWPHTAISQEVLNITNDWVRPRGSDVTGLGCSLSIIKF